MLFFYQRSFLNRVRRDLKLLLNKEKLSNTDITFLEEAFPFYAGLKRIHQVKFNQRLEVILTIKEFIPRGSLQVVTREMKLLIAGLMVMITFGWRRVRLPHFDKILIYPDTYYSTISKKYHKGEVNPKLGIIVISWINFLEGLKSGSDGVNLGIHEIAHALKLENSIRNSGEHSFFNPKVYHEFQVLAKQEIAKMNLGNDTIFRPSAALNEHEFFAVALEVFFEQSHAFFDYNPQLYGVLVQLLQQDPRVWLKRAN